MGVYDDDPIWDALFADSQPMLIAMAEEALRDAKAGLTTPMEEFLAEEDPRPTLRQRFWNMLIDLAARTNNDQLFLWAMRHR